MHNLTLIFYIIFLKKNYCITKNDKMHFLMHSLTKSKIIIIIIIIISPFFILLKSRGFLNDCDYHNYSQHRPTVTQLFPSISRIRSTNLSLSTKRKSNQKSETTPKLHFPNRALPYSLPNSLSLSQPTWNWSRFLLTTQKKKKKRKKRTPPFTPTKFNFYFLFFNSSPPKCHVTLVSFTRV